MAPLTPLIDLPFLAGGGEMGALIRANDWSKTPLGHPASWPQSLRTSISIVLNSRFPMFLFWGKDLTSFYNDAFRPSLGNNGKHPGILGASGEEAWREIWTTIKPLLDQVLGGGEAIWQEDALIPIYRNGKMEDVYWTFSYSPVHGESGNVEGVFVTCVETSRQIATIKKLEESRSQLRSTILHAPVAMAIFRGKDYTVEIVNDRALELWGRKEEEVLHKPILEVMTELKSQGIKELLDEVYRTSTPFYATEMPIEIWRKGKLENTYINFVYDVLHNSSGEVDGIVTVGFEVNAQVLARQKIEESEKRFRDTVMQAPVGITIFHGPEFIVEMANQTYLQIVDRRESEFVGRPLFDSLPEVKEAVGPLLTQVLTTGKPYYGMEFPVTLNRFGRRDHTFFNFVYHPLRNEHQEITGIIVVATEVTDSVLAKQGLTESEKQFRNLMMNSPIPMAVFRGEDFVIEMANRIMFENVWKKEEEDILGKKLLDVFPELKGQKYPKLLKRVYDTGKPHSEKESVAFVRHNDELKKFYLDYEYAPLRDLGGQVTGLIVTVNDVTEKVETRIRVEDSEREYRDIAERLNIVIDASELGTWEWDLDTDQISYSDRYLEIFGHSDHITISHQDHLAHVHPDDLKKRALAMTAALETGLLNYEIRILWNDGSAHWIEAKGKVFYDEKERPVKLIGTVRDTTDKNRHQQELFESETKFRLLADSMPQQIWTSDTAGNLNYFNKSVFTYSGLSPDEIHSAGWLQIVHPDDREENIRKWAEAIATGQDFLLEHRFRRYDGEYRWQLSRAIPQRDTEGKIQMWVGTSTDIQEQKMFASELEKKVRERTRELDLLNESLRKSEERYHLMVEEIQEYAILYINREGVVENWNKGAEKIKGYRADEIIGKNFREFYPDEDRRNNLPESLLERAIQTGKAIQEGQRVRKDGTRFWASVVITAVHDNTGNVIGFSKVTHDLTEKKAAQDAVRINAEQIALKNAELEKMNAELKSFAYVSSHDLQEPLRKIQTFASRILSKEMDTLSDNAKDYFRRMQDAASRMQTLIQDLLAYSRTSTTDLVFEKADLAAIVDEVKNDSRELLAEKQATIEMGKMVEAHVIGFQFRQLVTNLIGNSVKFARPDVPPHIFIESEIAKGSTLGNTELSPQRLYCHLVFSDNGIGFDPQYRNRIFEVFQRLHGKEEYSGTGIGLAIVKKIVENHHGLITATGELNKGARFDIYLPVDRS